MTLALRLINSYTVVETYIVKALIHLSRCLNTSDYSIKSHALRPSNSNKFEGDRWAKVSGYINTKQLEYDTTLPIILDFLKTMCKDNERECKFLITINGQNARVCTHPSKSSFPRKHRYMAAHYE